MIATRVGSGIAAEIGSMTVTEQVDALRMCNATPSCTSSSRARSPARHGAHAQHLRGHLVATIAGMLIANVVFDINYRTFLSLQLVSPTTSSSAA
jgi:phospholipid/cholesterol/gamma-HCH transport system permease protein